MQENTRGDPTYAVGEEVRVSLPDADGPDAQYHGRRATVVDVAYDELGALDDRPELNEMYTLEFEDGTCPSISFRVHDIESPSE